MKNSLFLTIVLFLFYINNTYAADQTPSMIPNDKHITIKVSQFHNGYLEDQNIGSEVPELEVRLYAKAEYDVAGTFHYFGFKDKGYTKQFGFTNYIEVPKESTLAVDFSFSVSGYDLNDELVRLREKISKKNKFLGYIIELHLIENGDGYMRKSKTIAKIDITSNSKEFTIIDKTTKASAKGVVSIH